VKDHDQDPLSSRLKRLVADLFRLDLSARDSLSDHEPLFGGRLGLDSLDAIELAMSVEEEFGITIHTREESLSAFTSIASLADFIEARSYATAKQDPGVVAA
jgi:acyl carrier protein